MGLSCLRGKAWLTFFTYQTDPHRLHSDRSTAPLAYRHGCTVEGKHTHDYITLWSVTSLVKLYICFCSICVTTQLVDSVTVDAHDVCCVFRCCGKSPVSSCWLLSSVLSFWDWLSVSLLYWFQFSFTVYVYHCGLFSHDTSVLKLIRSSGEQVQYKACAGYYCCAGSGLLHHSGNDRGNDLNNNLNNVKTLVRYTTRTTKVENVQMCFKLIWCYSRAH